MNERCMLTVLTVWSADGARKAEKKSTEKLNSPYAEGQWLTLLRVEEEGKETTQHVPRSSIPATLRAVACVA